jgi:DNA-directed RNA polymerase subunit alpha
MSSENAGVRAVDEICSQPVLTPDLLLRLRMIVRSDQGERDALEARLEALSQEVPAPEERAVRQAGFAWILGRHREAERVLRDLDTGMQLLLRGGIAMDRGDPASAVDLLEGAVARFPGLPSLRIEVARALESCGRVDESLQILTALEGEGVSDADAFFVKGRCLERMRRFEEACACYENALELDARHTEAVFRLAYQLDLRGDDQGAIQLYRRILAREDAFVSAKVNLALLLEDKDDLDGTIELLNSALKSAPHDERVQLHLRNATESLHMYYDENKRKEEERLASVLQTPITDFELSLRSQKCLDKMKVRNLGDLVSWPEHELLAQKNFGDGSLREIKGVLESRGLRLGMLAHRSLKRATGDTRDTEGVDPAALLRPVAQLDLSSRSRKCLAGLRIQTIGELVKRSEEDLMTVKNFGRTSLNEIKARLAKFKLSLKSSKRRPVTRRG